MTDQLNQISDRAQKIIDSAEEQVSDLLSTIEEQDAQVWAYLIGGVVALLVGLIAAYFYAQSVREKRKSRLERIKGALRGGFTG